MARFNIMEELFYVEDIVQIIAKFTVSPLISLRLLIRLTKSSRQILKNIFYSEWAAVWFPLLRCQVFQHMTTCDQLKLELKIAGIVEWDLSRASDAIAYGISGKPILHHMKNKLNYVNGLIIGGHNHIVKSINICRNIQTYFNTALKYNNKEIVTFLYHCASSCYIPTLCWTNLYRNNDVEFVKWIIENVSGFAYNYSYNDFRQIIKHGNIEIIELIKSRDVNMFTLPCIKRCIKEHRYDILEYLCDTQTRINEKYIIEFITADLCEYVQKYISKINHDTATHLIIDKAINTGCFCCLKTLIEYGCSISFRDFCRVVELDRKDMMILMWPKINELMRQIQLEQ